MNELEKALEQLNIKYEMDGKQYKIPTTKENLVELLKGYIAFTNDLQSKIDKANELIKRKLSTETYQHLKKLYDDIIY